MITDLELEPLIKYFTENIKVTHEKDGSLVFNTKDLWELKEFKELQGKYNLGTSKLNWIVAEKVLKPYVRAKFTKV